MPCEAGGGIGAGLLAQAPMLNATAASAMIARYFMVWWFPLLSLPVGKARMIVHRAGLTTLFFFQAMISTAAPTGTRA